MLPTIGLGYRNESKKGWITHSRRRHIRASWCTGAFIMQEAYLDLCKRQIEEKMGWGPSDEWSTQDFEELSIRIQDSASQVISATTLKRIWGRVAYDSSPSRHSLDALSIFLGYSSWRDFMSSNKLPERPADTESTEEIVHRPVAGLPVGFLSLFMLLLGGGIVLWLGLRGAEQEPDNPSSDLVSFSTRPVAYDLPNTVVFEYDVSAIEADSFFIQQSWDRNLRTRVTRDHSIHTSTYFYPGYYSAKLIANDSISGRTSSPCQDAGMESFT